MALINSLPASWHPARLAVLARTRGLKPTPVTECRVLCLGCGDGLGLVNPALTLPGASFYGLDAAAEAIERGLRAWREMSGPDNLNLMTLDEFPRNLPPFDYILLPAMERLPLEWTDTEVLDFCREQLAGQGLLGLGYYSPPGTEMWRALAESLKAFDPEIRSQCLAAGEELCGEAGALFQEQFARLREDLAQDWLGGPGRARYFQQIAWPAWNRGLRYLGEDNVGEFPANPEWRTEERIFQEQCRDFLHPRERRHSLFCHAEAEFHEVSKPQSEIFREFYFASEYQPLSQDPPLEFVDMVVRYQNPAGELLTETDPLAKSALCCLGECWPDGLGFETLYSRAVARLSEAEFSREPLAEKLWNHWINGSLMLSAAPWPTVEEPGPCPEASPLARWQFANGEEAVLNLLDQVESLPPIVANFLPYLDGRHDREALLKVLFGWLEQGYIQPGANEALDGAGMQASLDGLLAQLLAYLRHAHLLLSTPRVEK